MSRRDAFWVWDPVADGYRPRSTEWWQWDPVDVVMRPRPATGWGWDPLARQGEGDWFILYERLTPPPDQPQRPADRVR